MKELSKANGNSPVASNAMVMFGVLNAVCIQLIPSTVLIIRQQAGSLNPSSILPNVWISSVASMMAGIIAAKLMERRDSL